MIVAEAMAWIGTPYRHQASRKGVGCDCLGLVRGVWRAIEGTEPEAPGPYAPDWAERAAGDPLIEAAGRHLIRRAHALPGDVLLFRWRAGMAAKHAGILIADDRFVHAYQEHCVQVSALVPAWRRRIAGIFAFPETTRSGS